MEIRATSGPFPGALKSGAQLYQYLSTSNYPPLLEATARGGTLYFTVGFGPLARVALYLAAKSS